MNFIEKLNRFVGLYLTAFGTTIKGGAWLPFLIYTGLQMSALIFVVNYTNPFIYPLLSPLIVLIAGENASLFDHYPTLYLLLPFVYQWFKIAIGIIFEGLAAGLTIVLILRILAPTQHAGLKLAAAYKKWPQLLLVWTIITAILWSIDTYLPPIFAEQLADAPRRQMAFNIILRLLTVGIYSILMYAIPALIVRNAGFLKSFRISIKLFIKYPIFSFFLAFIPILMTLPASYGAANADIIVQKFSPELVFYIIFAGLFVEFIANYLLMATLVKFMVDETE